MSLGTVLLVQIFPALLPPENPEDKDFYSVLDLKSRNVSEQEIRKAYKKKSLSLHPDKIAQRRENSITAEEAAKEYQLVQEAHTCLADKASRQKYHAVRCSPTRYRFLTQGGGMGNHMGLLENLSNASFGDKTRLVLFVSTFPALLLLQPILIAVKVNHILTQDGALEDASWMALLTPWWIFHGLFVLFWMMVTCFAPPGSRLPIAATAIEHLFWFIAEVLLALRWDNSISGAYAAVFIPAYLALAIKWLHFVVTLHSITLDMSKMVSKNYFVDVILHGREPEELEEEELKELQDKYVVVSQIPLEVEASFDRDDGEEGENRMSEQEKEDIRVASSREFEHALEAYSTTRRAMIKSIILDITFIILLIIKVDDHKDISWWIVFLPVWLSYGLRLFYNCFVCCCSVGPMSADEVFIISKAKEAMDTANNGNNDTGDENKENGDDHEEGEVGNEKVEEGPRPDDKIGTEQPGAAKPDTTKEAHTEGQDHSVKDAVNSIEKKEAEAAASEETSSSLPEQKAAAPNVDSNKDASDPENIIANEAKEGDSNKKENGDEEFNVHMDEEAYRAYRSAYAEAEADAMENRVRAGQTTCIACIQLILVLLLVIKLEQAYDAEEERDESNNTDVDVGYNALWMLFPLFLIVGFMISCCACLIYGAPSPEDLMQQEEGGSDSGEGNEDDEETGKPDEEAAESNPVVLAPPPPEPAAATNGEEASTTKEEEDKKAEIKPVEPDEAEESEQTKQPTKQEADDDINDLD